MSCHPSVARCVVALFAFCAVPGGSRAAGLWAPSQAAQPIVEEVQGAWRQGAAVAGSFAAHLDLVDGAAPLGSALAFLPVRTVLVLRALLEPDVAESAAATISRQDTLWFQAGAGDPGMSYLEGSNLAPPKWNGAFPSIAEPADPQASQDPPDASHFTFQLGR